MKNQSVIPLLEKWETFSEQHPKGDIYDFGRWLTSQERADKQRDLTMDNNSNGARIGVLITRLQKYLGLYVRPVIAKLGFTREHEYNFLYQITRMEKPNRNDLSKENLIEFSTGRDVIRRLIAKKLVTEKPDSSDRRASLLSITSAGKKLLDKSYQEIGAGFGDFMGDLSLAEQEQLIVLLTKLNAFQATKFKRQILAYL